MSQPDPIKVGNFMFIIMPLAMLACFAMSFCSMPDEPRSPMIDRMGSADMGKGGGE
ncbi:MULTISPECIES: hypothetical protein [Sphingomonadales]|jgi:hypothetical protein|uniref:hypothetical protein n=1 Tax=Sphingomonadales TaxID=204457 RepID=UPI000A4FAF09|nr:MULTISPECIES: hypothetical protein [Sphingomonadales]